MYSTSTLDLRFFVIFFVCLSKTNITLQAPIRRSNQNVLNRRELQNQLLFVYLCVSYLKTSITL